MFPVTLVSRCVSLVSVLATLHVLCVATCGLPAIYRVWQRKSSTDLSLGREILLIAGIAAQISVMVLTDADWRVFLGPVFSLLSIGTLAGVVLWYRQ